MIVIFALVVPSVSLPDVVDPPVAPCVEGFGASGVVGGLVLPWVDMGLGVSPSELAVEDCIG